MRVKQTARKSTGGTRDPIRKRIGLVLATKRRSRTPAPSVPGNYGRGKEITHLVKIKPRNTKSTKIALREIKRLQNSYENLIPRAAFHRVVREITQGIGEQEYRYQVAALEALQEAAEAYIVRVLENSYLCTLHSGRVTLFVKDVQLFLRIQASPQIC